MDACGIGFALSEKLKKCRGLFRVNRAPFSEFSKPFIVQSVSAIFAVELLGVILERCLAPNPQHGLALYILPCEKAERFKRCGGMREKVVAALGAIHQNETQTRNGRGLRDLRYAGLRGCGLRDLRDGRKSLVHLVPFKVCLSREAPGRMEYIACCMPSFPVFAHA